MSERLPCKTPGCTGTILPTTAAKTGGYCMPCVQRQAYEERRRYVAEHRVEIDRYAGVTDPVEIIMLMHEQPALDPLKSYVPYPKSLADMYRALTAGETQRLIERTLARLEAGSTDAEEAIAYLACFTTADLAPLQRWLTATGEPQPAVAFRSASDEVVDELIQLLEREVATGGPAVSLTLPALAWTRHPRAEALFRTWRLEPPAWSHVLDLPPHVHAQSAGWTVEESGEPRELARHVCHRLVPKKKRPARSAPVRTLLTSDVPCGFCGRPLTVLLDLDLTSPDLAWLGVAGERLRLPTCEACVCSTPLFFDVDAEGSLAWNPSNTNPGFLLDPEDESSRLPRERLVLGPSRPPLEVADAGISEHESQVGGLPTWIQNVEYPECPSCGRPMTFLAQIAVEDVADGEGIYYTFLCERCWIAGAHYQQT